MADTTQPKTLTHDEKKAADAAFARRPFNASWSASARVVYDGITNALPQAELPSLSDTEPAGAEEIASLPATSLAGSEPVMDAPDTRQAASEDARTQPADPTIKDLQTAIQAGILIDVTPTAQQLGLTFPVTITKPLWEIGVVTTGSLSEAEQAGRLRDILMAFRLRLASLATISPLFDFPALLTMPPGTVPQPVPLFALIQPDAKHHANVTLLLPNEVSLSIAPTN